MDTKSKCELCSDLFEDNDLYSFVYINNDPDCRNRNEYTACEPCLEDGEMNSNISRVL